VIRGVHYTGEQPLLVDLEAPPLPGDTVLVCSNLRSTGGKRPSFIDAMASTFVIPYQHIRSSRSGRRAAGGGTPIWRRRSQAGARRGSCAASRT
jgi:hypothetical protein